jgi:hypothetical protein
MAANISVIHATRRPKQALEIRDKWIAAADSPAAIEWIFGIDDDDLPSRQELTIYPHTISPAGGGCVRAYNEAATKANGEIIVCASDDMMPIPYWDTVIEQRIGDTSKPALLIVGDGIRQDKLSTCQILTRALYQKHGCIFHPRFKSMGGDVWLTERAWRDGDAIDATDLIFDHHHPLYKAYHPSLAWDTVYAEENHKTRYEDGWRLLDELLEPLPISLCMIVSNEEQNIERCLESAKNAFDELCIVRAIGSQEPDRTIAIAREWATHNRKPFYWGEYTNKLPFPHVDDFAAARNLSFSLATGYWRLWLDADDVLDDVNCKRIREASHTARFDCHSFRYVMPSGGEYYRERLIKSGCWNWVGAVHEACHVKGSTCRVPQCFVTHMPKDDGHRELRSASRNLAILETIKEKTPRDLFYVHEELYRLNRKEEAIQAGKHAITALADDMVEGLYQVHLHLCELEPDKTVEHAMNAFRVQPFRREAFAYLTQYALNQGLIDDAIQYFKWMDSVPVPNPKPWTHQHAWHGWARNYLEVRILRTMGRKDEANTLHAKFISDPDYAKWTNEAKEVAA